MISNEDLRSVFRAHRRGIALTLALLLLTLLAGAGLLGLAGHFLTAASLAGAAALSFNFFGPSAGIRALTFARILSRYAEKLVGHDVTLRIARDLRVWFFQRMLPLAPLGLGRQRIGDLLARLVADIETLDGLLVRGAGPLLALAGLGVIATLVATCVLPLAGLVLLATLVLLGVAVPWSAYWRARGLEAERGQWRARFRQGLQEGLEGAADLRALQASAAWLQRMDADARALADCELRRKRRLSLATLLHGVVTAVALPVMLGVLLEGVHRQALSPAAASGVFFLTVALLEACAGIGLAWQAVQAARVAAKRLQAVAGQPPLVADTDTPLPVPEAGLLEFRAVDFQWPGPEGRPLLRQLDLQLAPGERIAIGGDSGEGKSSLLALALRLCDPQQGHLRYGGVDLRQMSLQAWHERVTWLPQDAPVFAGTVRDNLMLGDAEADDETLWQQLAQVRLNAHFRQLPEGLDSWIGENGASLSAGQARRLALARALLRGTPVLLLDEPTEGLDQDTADALMRDLARASEGRSVLIISHDRLPDGVVHRHYRLQDGGLA